MAMKKLLVLQSLLYVDKCLMLVENKFLLIGIDVTDFLSLVSTCS